MELGGKNAGLVFADADFDAAVDGIARASFANTGQICLGTERVYVERRSSTSSSPRSRRRPKA